MRQEVASLSYKAILKVLPVVAVKSCVPFKSSTLKLVQIADVIAISYLLKVFVDGIDNLTAPSV